jgi:hypothetical protein
MATLKYCTTQELIDELSRRRFITFIPTPKHNRVEVVVDDCDRKYTKRMPDGEEYTSNSTYDEFHENSKGILVIGNDT